MQHDRPSPQELAQPCAVPAERDLHFLATTGEVRTLVAINGLGIAERELWRRRLTERQLMWNRMELAAGSAPATSPRPAQC